MSPKIDDIVATLREYAPDEDGTQRYILIPAAGRGAIAEYPVTVRSHRTDIMREAADLIEELQRELEDERYRHDRYADYCVAADEERSALKERARWIPVEERLPEHRVAVLTICVARREGSKKFHRINYYDAIMDEWELTYPPHKVTHWMPLPEPPKEG